MITLHHCRDARSFRPLWALEEIGLAYELKLLPFPPRYRAREYLELNPLGTVPLMVDGETRMSESAAICQYLADRYSERPLRILPEEPAYGAYLNALHFGEATLTFPQTLVLRYRQMEPPERRVEQAAADYAKWAVGRMRGFETWLAGAEYVAAGRFTVADISIGYALMLTQASGLWDQIPASLQAYFARLSARPAFARAKAAQGGDGNS